MKQLKCLYTVFFAVGWPLGDTGVEVTPIMMKFVLVGVVAPLVAVYMIYEDENTEDPNFKQIAMTLLTSSFFIWLGYEATIHFMIPAIAGYGASFFIGLSALPIIRVARKKIPEAIGKAIDMLPDGLQKFFKR